MILFAAFVDSSFAAGDTEHAASDEYKRPDLPCQELDVSENSIGLKGGCVVARLLERKAPRLKVLNLAWNNLRGAADA